MSLTIRLSNLWAHCPLPFSLHFSDSAWLFHPYCPIILKRALVCVCMLIEHFFCITRIDLFSSFYHFSSVSTHLPDQFRYTTDWCGSTCFPMSKFSVRSCPWTPAPWNTCSPDVRFYWEFLPLTVLWRVFQISSDPICLRSLLRWVSCPGWPSTSFTYWPLPQPLAIVNPSCDIWIYTFVYLTVPYIFKAWAHTT